MYKRKPQQREVSWDGARANGDRSLTLSAELDHFPSTPNIDRLILQEAIQKLPRHKRAVFMLHEVSGMTHREIGKKLNLTVENSKCRLLRARMKLRQALAS
jgi:RNA polymerase sigma factor (sigma-70 family)